MSFSFGSFGTKKIGNFGTFPDYEVRAHSGTHTVHSDEDGKRVGYISISGAQPEDLTQLHRIFEHLKWDVNILPPVKFENHSEKLLVAECFDSRSVLHLPKNWFFQSFPTTFNKTTRKWSYEQLYATLQYLILIWSIIKTVDHFLSTPFRPIIDLSKMYVAKDGNVIFTSFEKRVKKVHTRKFEATEVSSALMGIVSAMSNSKVANKEFTDLCQWLDSSDFGKAKGIEEAFQHVVFWTSEMRIDYMTELYEEIEVGTAIYPDTGDAFKVDGSTDNWRTIIEKTGNPVLDTVLANGDASYAEKVKANKIPRWFRTSNMSSFRDFEIVDCGITRIRDGLHHTKDNNLEHETLGVVNDIVLQAMFQSLFPDHMIRLAKAQSKLNFEGVDHLRIRFGASRIKQHGSTGLAGLAADICHRPRAYQKDTPKASRSRSRNF